MKELFSRYTYKRYLKLFDCYFQVTSSAGGTRMDIYLSDVESSSWKDGSSFQNMKWFRRMVQRSAGMVIVLLYNVGMRHDDSLTNESLKMVTKYNALISRLQHMSQWSSFFSEIVGSMFLNVWQVLVNLIMWIEILEAHVTVGWIFLDLISWFLIETNALAALEAQQFLFHI